MFANVDENFKGSTVIGSRTSTKMQQRIQRGSWASQRTIEPGRNSFAAVAQIATSEVGDANLPFLKWGPSLRASFMHFWHPSMLYFSRQDKSPSLVRLRKLRDKRLADAAKSWNEPPAKRSAFSAIKAAQPKRAACIVAGPLLFADNRPNKPIPVRVGGLFPRPILHRHGPSLSRSRIQQH